MMQRTGHSLSKEWRRRVQCPKGQCKSQSEIDRDISRVMAQVDGSAEGNSQASAGRRGCEELRQRRRQPRCM